MGLRMRNVLLAATTLAAARGAVAGEVPGALLTLEVSAPLPAGFVVSALPPRFVLLEDGQVFVGGASSVGAGRLDKAEVKALEERLALVRKLPGLGSTIAFGGALAPRSHLLAPKSKLDVVATGDPASAPPARDGIIFSEPVIGCQSAMLSASERFFWPSALRATRKQGSSEGAAEVSEPRDEHVGRVGVVKKVGLHRL